MVVALQETDWVVVAMEMGTAAFLEWVVVAATAGRRCMGAGPASKSSTLFHTMPHSWSALILMDRHSPVYLHQMLFHQDKLLPQISMWKAMVAMVMGAVEMAMGATTARAMEAERPHSVRQTRRWGEMREKSRGLRR